MSKQSYDKFTKQQLIDELNKMQRKVNKVKKLEENYKTILQELENSEAGFKEIFESRNDSIFLMDKDKFIDCNKRTLELFGVTRKQIIGKSPQLFSPEKQPDGSNSSDKAHEYINLTYQGIPQFFEWTHKKNDGTIFETEVSLTRIRLSQKYWVLAIVRDISERKKSELNQSAVYEIAAATISVDNLNEIFIKIHEIVGKLIPANNFYIALYDEKIDLFTFPYFVDEEDDPPGPMKLGNTLTEYVYRTGEPLFATPEIMKELEDKGEIGMVGTPSNYWIGVPLKTNEQSIGVLAVQSYHDDQILTKKDKDILVFVSSQIAMAINRVGTKNALKVSEERYRSFYNETPVMLQTIDNDYRLTSVSNYWLKMLGYEREEVIGKKFYDFVTDETKHYILNSLLPKYQKMEFIDDAPSQFLKKNGDILDILISAISDKDSSGKIIESHAVLIDITKKRRIEKALEIEKMYFEELFQTAPEAMVILDYESNILRVNKEFTYMFGYKENEVLGKNVDELLTTPELRNEASEITAAVQDGEKISMETVRLRRDGSYVHVSILASPIQMKGEKLAVFGIYRDITERKVVEEKIKEYNEELKSLNQDKDKFFSIVAHDLKSPFTALLGYSEVIALECEELSIDELKEFSTNIHDVAKNVNDLLNNLLDWSRIQTGRLKFEPEKLNLHELSQKVCGLFFDYAKRKNVELTNKVAEEVYINGDRNMVYTILRNLTSNALKFTNSGGSINISSARNGNNIEISVTDSGVGIPADVLDKLFQSDSQHTTLGTEKEQGTGLGLRLCKEMVNKHGGEISVTSVIGEGSKFTFTIPVD